MAVFMSFPTVFKIIDRFPPRNTRAGQVIASYELVKLHIG